VYIFVLKEAVLGLLIVLETLFRLGWVDPPLPLFLDVVHFLFLFSALLYVVETYLLYTFLLSIVSTTVKISKDYKDQLDRLQAKLLITTGKKVSLQALLELLVSLGVELEGELAERVAAESGSLSPAEIVEILNQSTDWTVETSEENIDEILYGDEKS
jgi:hypothetical protein